MRARGLEGKGHSPQLYSVQFQIDREPKPIKQLLNAPCETLTSNCSTGLRAAEKKVKITTPQTIREGKTLGAS